MLSKITSLGEFYSKERFEGVMQYSGDTSLGMKEDRLHEMAEALDDEEWYLDEYQLFMLCFDSAVKIFFFFPSIFATLTSFST